MPSDDASPKRIARRMVSVCEKLWKSGDEALKRAKDAQSPLRARSYGVGRMAKGDVADTTGDVGAARANRRSWESQYDQLVTAMRDLEAALMRVEALVDKQFQKGDRRKTRQAGSGLCVACGEHVPGIGEDRLKSGLCPKHYTGYHRARRATGVTRAEYIDGIKRGDNDDVL